MSTRYFLKRFIFTICFVLIAIVNKAQSIDELEIIPENPINSDDIVSVIATTWHPNSGCPIVGDEIFYSQDTITLQIQHQLGLATAICNPIDTTSMGTFNPGTYVVEYIMLSSLFGNIIVTDTAYTEFTVEDVNSADRPAARSRVNIYPNPSAGNLFIETEWRGNFAVYDILGKELERFRIDISPFHLSTEDFEPGVYILMPFGKSTFEGQKFIVR